MDLSADKWSIDLTSRCVHLCVCTFLTVLTCTWTIRGKASKVPEPLGYNVITEVCALRLCAVFLRLDPLHWRPWSRV